MQEHLAWAGIPLCWGPCPVHALWGDGSSRSESFLFVASCTVAGLWVPGWAAPPSRVKDEASREMGKVVGVREPQGRGGCGHDGEGQRTGHPRKLCAHPVPADPQVCDSLCDTCAGPLGVTAVASGSQRATGAGLLPTCLPPGICWVQE